MNDCTITLAVDEQHAAELDLSYWTWVKYRPEVATMPMVVFCDTMARSLDGWRIRLPYLSQARFVAWDYSAGNQREKMLAAFVVGVGSYIDTSYFVKIDTDAICTAAGPLVDPNWLRDDPVFVASPWSYSKPADAIDRLERWADGLPQFADVPRLNLPFDPSAGLVRHQRIISYFYIGMTRWHQWAASLIVDRLPIPSQDTYHSYLAERTRSFYRRVQMKHHGWRHVGRGGDRLKQAAAEVLQGAA